MDTIELRPAFAWDCGECGRENFERGIVMEQDAESLATLREEWGVPEDVSGDFVTTPKVVKCKYCSTEFKVAHFREDFDISLEDSED